MFFVERSDSVGLFQARRCRQKRQELYLIKFILLGSSQKTLNSAFEVITFRKLPSDPTVDFVLYFPCITTK